MARKNAISSYGGPKASRRSDTRADRDPSGRAAPSKPPAGRAEAGLYLISTPIGNAADISRRALDILGAADVVACEDTRVSAKLMAIHGIAARLTTYHEHNAAKVRPELIKRLKRGETVALIADAGTPLISDPGYKLVRACIEEALPVSAVPGPSAVLAALLVSGLPTDRFLFAGFLPPRQVARRKALHELAAVPASLVIMESPRRLARALADMADILGPRQAAVGRELTKMFEEVRRGPLAELAAHYDGAGAPKGEVTVVVAPPAEKAPAGDAEIDRRLADALAETSVREAARQVAAATGAPRRRVYARALEIRKAKGSPP